MGDGIANAGAIQCRRVGHENGAMLQIVAAIILAAGAFYGVYKGAVYAVERLTAQLAEERRLAEERLDAEAERLQTQLDAEAERLTRQLSHDRSMREIEELRRMIDEAATTGLKAGSAVHVFRSQVGWIVEDDGEVNAMYATKRADAHQAVSEMQGFVERFELRLGPGHAVPWAFSEWQVAIESALSLFETTPPDLDALRNGSKQLDSSAENYLDFMDASRSCVRLDPPLVA
jgi:hypothetical protein